MVAKLDEDRTENVSGIEMRVRYGEWTPEAQARFERRSEVLAAWLLDRWRQRQREIAERN